MNNLLATFCPDFENHCKNCHVDCSGKSLLIICISSMGVVYRGMQTVYSSMGVVYRGMQTIYSSMWVVYRGMHR